ncbi:Alpha/Beta hydrolase protein [Talaromyces proteolyticus]|uniref:Alpha/Beta hydrolase protein n=1 Tax=Talaromyces proteolyticus TaxID=1131652 RepID=A0AAD4PUU1_9EURO|nr:Alpha/Beta hydrolase protein [Talaromyces proteolyticus]KAH8695501.1 Alpha/Beta hydrolase protein [Talaromyces proteolyticus]
MAVQIFPSISNKATLSDGTTYAYIRVPADHKPTFLLLHGFPSSSYDWRHIVPMLTEHGYGVIAPDLLGYGDSDKSKDYTDYSLSLVRHEGLNHVIGVGHLLVTVAHPTLFSAVVFLAVGYFPPGRMDIDAANSIGEKVLGYTNFGYWYFFNENTAGSIPNAAPDSLNSLLYSTTAEDWKTIMGPVSSAKVAPPPSWLSQEERDTHIRIFQKGGYTGPLSWYKSCIRGVDEPFYSKFETDESKTLDFPALVITAEYDYVCHPEFQKPAAQKYLTNGRVEQLQCSHWVPLEKPAKLFKLLDEFASGL